MFCVISVGILMRGVKLRCVEPRRRLGSLERYSPLNARPLSELLSMLSGTFRRILLLIAKLFAGRSSFFDKPPL